MNHIFKVGDKGKTRDGRDYEVMLIDPAHHRPIVAKIRPKPESCHQEKYLTFFLDGRSTETRCQKWAADLMPPTEYVWVNWSRYKDGSVFMTSYSDEGSALKFRGPLCFKSAVKTEVPRP